MVKKEKGEMVRCSLLRFTGNIPQLQHPQIKSRSPVGNEASFSPSFPELNSGIEGVLLKKTKKFTSVPTVTLGIADGKYKIPDDINQYDDQIDEMFGL